MWDCGAQEGTWVSSEKCACKRVWVVICLIRPNLFSHLLWGLRRGNTDPLWQRVSQRDTPRAPGLGMEGRRLTTPETWAAPVITGEIIFKGDMAIFWGNLQLYFASNVVENARTNAHLLCSCPSLCSMPWFGFPPFCIASQMHSGLPFYIEEVTPLVLGMLSFGKGNLHNLLPICLFINWKWI